MNKAPNVKQFINWNYRILELNGTIATIQGTHQHSNETTETFKYDVSNLSQAKIDALMERGMESTINSEVLRVQAKSAFIEPQQVNQFVFATSFEDAISLPESEDSVVSLTSASDTTLMTPVTVIGLNQNSIFFITGALAGNEVKLTSAPLDGLYACPNLRVPTNKLIRYFQK